MRCVKCDTTIPPGLPTCVKCGWSKGGPAQPASGPSAPAPAPGILKAAPPVLKAAPPKAAPAKKAARRIPQANLGVQKRLQRNMEQRAANPKTGIKLVVGAVTLVVIVVGGLLLFNYVTKRFDTEQGERLLLEDHATLNFDQVAAFDVTINEHTWAFVRVESTGECTAYIINRKHLGTPLQRDDINRLNQIPVTVADDIVIRSGSGRNFQIKAPVAGGRYGVFICNWLPGEKTQDVKVKVSTSHKGIGSLTPAKPVAAKAE